MATLTRGTGTALSVPWGAQVRARLGPLVVAGLPFLLGLLVATPIVLLLANSFNLAAPGQAAQLGLENWASAAADPATLPALGYSLSLSAVRVAIALALALPAAWLIGRTDMPGRSILEVLAWLSIFVPLLPLTLGWMLLLDPNYGLINQALMHLPFVHGPIFNIYSFAGIIWVHLASTSVAIMVVLLLPSFQRIGAALEEAARVCGATQPSALLRITIPLVAPAALAIALLSFVRGLEAFEVELLLGTPANIPVFSTRIYNLVRDQPAHYGEATALGFIFLVILLGLAAMYQRALRDRSYTTVTGHGYSAAPVQLGRWRWIASCCCFGWFAIALAAPLTFLVLGSFMKRYGFFELADPFTLTNWQTLFRDPIFVSSARNSIVIAVGVAILVVVLYSLVAYHLVRTRARVSRATDFLVWLPWAVPGVLMSLGMLWVFLGTPLRSVLYGSVFSVVLAIAVKDSPLSTQFFRAGILQIGAELEEGARVCGASWLRTFTRVLLPLLAPTAITVGLLGFLDSIRDVATPVLLSSSGNQPLAVLMLSYSTTAGRLEAGAAIGVLIVAFVLVVTVLVRLLGLQLAREQM